jgi:hypothetical protein
MKYAISLRGERDLWLEFVHKTKQEKKKVWEVLGPFLKKYISASKEERVLLLLFPKDLVDKLLAKEDPEEMIEDAIKKLLMIEN